MRILQMPDAIRYPSMTTAQLREAFLLDDLFQPGTVQNVYVDLDRTVIGSAVPLHQPLALPTYPELRADFFTERRELGVLNIGGLGKVRVDAETYVLDNLDCLYVGRGKHEVVFSSEDATRPAEFYLLSYPAHAEYPTRLSRRGDLEAGLAGLRRRPPMFDRFGSTSIWKVCAVASWCWALQRCNRAAFGIRCRRTLICVAQKFISTSICRRRIA